MTREITQTIHACYTSGEDESPLYYVVPGDYSRGYCLGERWELEQLHDKIDNILAGNTAGDGVILDTHPAIHEHVNVETAAVMAGISERGIRKAIASGAIRGAVKDGKSWTMPIRHLRHWIRDARAHRPGRKPSSKSLST